MPYKNIGERRKNANKYYHSNKEKMLNNYKKYRDKKLKTINKVGIKVNLWETDNIETIFKVEPPLTEISDGFGYTGVILRDKIEDKIQCHICGGWFKSLVSHIKTHGIKTRPYKIKYGLPLTYPLVNRGTSKKFSDTIMKTKLWEKSKITKLNKKGRKYSKKTLKYIRYGRTSSSFHNKNGVCEEQIKRRYLVISDNIGKEPSQREILENDRSLMRVIQRRYKNLNNFRKKSGYGVKNKPNKYSEEYLLGCIRNFVKLNKRVPKYNDFSKTKPYAQTFKNCFGSMNRALTLAGY